MDRSLPALEPPEEANPSVRLSHICMNYHELNATLLWTSKELPGLFDYNFSNEHNGVTERLTIPLTHLKPCWFWTITDCSISHTWLCHPLHLAIRIPWGSRTCLVSWESNITNSKLAPSKWQHPALPFLVKTSLLQVRPFLRTSLDSTPIEWASLTKGHAPSFHPDAQDRRANRLQSLHWRRSLYWNRPMKAQNPWLPCVKWHQAARRDGRLYYLYTYTFPGVFPDFYPCFKLVLVNCGNSGINRSTERSKKKSWAYHLQTKRKNYLPTAYHTWL